MGSERDESTPLMSFYDTVLGRIDAVKDGTCIKFCCGRKLAPGEISDWTTEQRRVYFDSGMCNLCQDTYAELADLEDLDGDEFDDIVDAGYVEPQPTAMDSWSSFWSKYFYAFFQLVIAFVAIELVLGYGFHLPDWVQGLALLFCGVVFACRAWQKGNLG